MSNISHSMLLGEWCCVSGIYLVNEYWLSLKEGERERWGGRVVPLRLRGCNWAAAASLRGGHWPLCHPLSTFRWHASKKKEAWHRDKQIDKQVDRQTSRQTDRWWGSGAHRKMTLWDETTQNRLVKHSATCLPFRIFLPQKAFLAACLLTRQLECCMQILL